MKIIRRGAVSAITLIAASVLLNSNLASAQDGALENPARNSTQSGIGMFSGWHCDAENIHIQFADGSEVLAAYGTSRGDTAGICGDSDNGFGLLFNFNLLGTGEHTVVALADGVEFGRRTFNVMRMSTGEFLSGASGQATVSDFPSAGHSVTLEWSQAQQNFNIISETIPAQGEGGVLDNAVVDSQWNNGLGAFDEYIGWATCFNDGGEACASLSWATVDDEDRGSVIEVTYAADAGTAAIFTEAAPPIDMSEYAAGAINFDVKVIDAGENTTGWIMKADCVYPCTSGDQAIGTAGLSGWETVQVPVSQLVDGGLDLTKVSTGLVIWPDPAANELFKYRIDNVYWSK